MGNRKSMDFVSRNRKVAKHRGDEWREKLRLAKLKNNDNPSMLAFIRNQKGLTQKEMTKLLGANTLAIYARIERGVRDTNRERASKIAKILGVRRSRIFVNVDQGRYLVV